jgi:RND family efflux transporter MFP subunit
MTIGLRVSALLLAAAAITACGHEQDPQATRGAAPVQLAAAVLAAELVPDEVRLDATLEAVHQATVAAQTNARVEALLFDVGDYVERDAVIVRFRATEQQARAASAQAAVREAEARLTDARAEFERVRGLVGQDVLPRSALDRATATLKSTQAQVESAREAAKAAGEQADYAVVRAPYSGIVVARHIEVGETATVGKPLMTGLSLEHLRAVVDVPQSAIAAVHARRQARVILPDGSSVDASELRIPPSADAQTHTFRVLVNLPEGRHGDPQSLFPGTLVKVAFLRDERRALLLPPEAVVRRSELAAVYVLDAQGWPLLRYVRLGTPQADGRVPVIAGLDEGERVALDPVAAAQLLKAGA